MEALAVDFLHVDLIDGHFSPSLPLGLEAVRQLRPRTQLPFDVHLMVTDNEFFILQLADIGVQRVCFHYESATHVDRLLQLAADYGIEAGIALKPMTPLSVLEYCLARIDYVLLMLINPGFAGHRGQTQVPYALRRVADCRKFLDQRGAQAIGIAVDGRISFDTIPGLVAAGAEVLVAGTQSLFQSEDSRGNNLKKMQAAIARGRLVDNPP